MATFGAWLKEAENSTNPQVSDGTKYLAKMWNETEGNRPKLYGVDSVKRFLEKQPTWSDQLNETFRATVAEYQKMRGDLAVVTDEKLGEGVSARLDALAAELATVKRILALIAASLGLLDDEAEDTAAGEHPAIELTGTSWDEADWSIAWSLADKQQAAGEETAA